VKGVAATSLPALALSAKKGVLWPDRDIEAVGSELMDEKRLQHAMALKEKPLCEKAAQHMKSKKTLSCCVIEKRGTG